MLGAMSDESSATGKVAPADPCMPCGGRGYVIASDAGEHRPVAGPWREGSGQRVVGVDAQARWTQGQESTTADSERSDASPGSPAAVAASSD